MLWLVLPTTTSLLPCSPLAPSPRLRAAVRMSSDAEAAARAAWLAKQQSPAWGPSAINGRERRSAEDQIAAQQREREEARKRMLDAMGGSNEQLSRGAGAAFGYFGQDTEDYGMGSEGNYEGNYPDEIDLATGMPLHGGIMQPNSGTAGFGGRKHGWRRRVEAVDPSGPRPENTLRAPGAGVAVQNYMYDLTPDAETQRQADEFKRQEEERRAEERRIAAMQQQEDDLLDALKGAFE